MSDNRPAVREPELAPEEKETLIRLSKVDERAQVYTEVRGVVGGLLDHPDAELEAATLACGEVVDGRENLDRDDTVVSWKGTVPIGAVKITATPRESTQPGRIVSRRFDNKEGEE